VVNVSVSPYAPVTVIVPVSRGPVPDGKGVDELEGTAEIDPDGLGDQG
jgi:hypothetical protein